jgi:hypothetical protein
MTSRHHLNSIFPNLSHALLVVTFRPRMVDLDDFQRSAIFDVHIHGLSLCIYIYGLGLCIYMAWVCAYTWLGSVHIHGLGLTEQWGNVPISALCHAKLLCIVHDANVALHGANMALHGANMAFAWRECSCVAFHSCRAMHGASITNVQGLLPGDQGRCW